MAHTDQIEFERVCWVFGLTGGEMSIQDESWLGHAYHYDGAPDYAEREMRDLAEEKGLDPWSIGTVLCTGGGYLSPAKETVTDDKGKVWHLLGVFNSSGEIECPGAQEEANSCGPTSRASCWASRCLLCKADRGEEHGYIYIGEGYEAVYATTEDE